MDADGRVHDVRHQRRDAGPRTGRMLQPGVEAEAIARKIETAGGEICRDQSVAGISFTARGSASLLERQADAQLGEMGHILDRKRFGAALFEEVVRQSGIVRVITSLNGVQRNGWVWMLSTDGWYLATSFIIDASGLRSVVGRGEAGVRRIVRLVAAYAVLEQNDMGKCLALLSDIDDSRP
jgi:hypothetical protein